VKGAAPPPDDPRPREEDARPVEPAPQELFCPRCGTPYEPGQEYCLECGLRLPATAGVVGGLSEAWQRRIPWYPGDWIWPVLLFLVIAVIAAVVAIVATRDGSSKPAVVATGPATESVPLTGPSGTETLPTAPEPTTGKTATTATTTGTTTTSPSAAVGTWPAGRSGYTVVLNSIPAAGGRNAAVAQARRARSAGLPQVGVLLSSQFSSLHPGYYVVFSGVYPSRSAADDAVTSAHSNGFGDAYSATITP
jgi:hypothetical protein